MRPELELIEKIEDFLKGRLSAEEMAAFRMQIAADPELQEKVRLQEDVMKGLERASLTQKVKNAGRSYHYGKGFRKWGWGGAATAVVVASTVLLFNYWKGNNHKIEGPLSQYNEAGKKEWADADRRIMPQVFTINGSRDTIIETKGGIIFSIPAKGFLANNGKPATGNFEVTVKEALDAETIVTCGLSTESDGRLLETGGMFYLDARTNNEILKIDPANGIYTGIPSDTIKPGMQLFQGKRMEDGSINWVNPKPVAHDLNPINIESLNFYPPHYLDSLKSWGYDITNKRFTDSLYYSFAARFGSPVYDGKLIFQSKCASCHVIGKDLTGPNLQGVIARWGGNMNQIRVWVHNYAKAVAAGYPRAKKVLNFSGSAMTQFEDALTDAEIDAVIEYANGYGDPLPSDLRDSAISNMSKTDSIQKLYDDIFASICGINPAKIRTIWSNEFQYTFIATREFEERLSLIHETFNPSILDLYINNLNKNLWEIDSMAAQMASMYEDKKFKNQFLALSARHDGNVKNYSPQLEKFRDYYQTKTKAYTDAITKTQNEFWNKQKQLDKVYNQKSYQSQEDSLERVNQNFTDEFTINLKDAYRQLGYDTNFLSRTNIQPATKPMYNIIVTNTGWNNVDKFVYETTEDRKDMSYTDPKTGKTANINYSTVEFNILNSGQYDLLYVYLVPDKLSSYMRVSGSDGKYAEKLNSNLAYDLVCIGYKGEKPFSYSKKGIIPGSYTIELSPTNQIQLNKELSGSSKQTADISKELNFMKYVNKDKIRQQYNLSLKELEWRVAAFIVCGEEGQPSYSPLLTDSTARKLWPENFRTQ
jgi:cytochrome c551/c552